MIRFYFFHIEKAAGTSLHEYFRRNIFQYHVLEPTKFSNDLTYTNKKIQERVLLGLSVLFRLKGVAGHCISPKNLWLSSNKSKNLYFTVLREPYSRTVSHYYYQKEVMGKNWSFSEFISQPQFQNFSCRKMSGEPSFLKSIKILDELGAVVGIMEKLNESLIVLDNTGLTKGFQFYGEVPKKNFRSSRFVGREGLSKSDLQLLERYNKEDVKLYAYYQRKLLETIDRNYDFYKGGYKPHSIRHKFIYFSNNLLGKTLYRIVERLLRKIFCDN